MLKIPVERTPHSLINVIISKKTRRGVVYLEFRGRTTTNMPCEFPEAGLDLRNVVR